MRLGDIVGGKREEGSRHVGSSLRQLACSGHAAGIGSAKLEITSCVCLSGCVPSTGVCGNRPNAKIRFASVVSKQLIH